MRRLRNRLERFNNWLEWEWPWLAQLIWAHHNARVLVDMEYRFSCILSESTGGAMSKAYYDLEVMRSEIEEQESKLRDEWYDEGYKDAKEEFEPSEKAETN
jgi:hypothetical protein